MKTPIILLLSLIACLSITASEQPLNHLVILYDSSRGVYVKLTNDQVLFNWGIGSNADADYWEPLAEDPTGTWTSDTRFTTQNGYFEQTQGDNWVEKLDSGVTHNFAKVQPGAESSQIVEIPKDSEHLVILYDSSRDIYILLTDTEAFFNYADGSDPNADYWETNGDNPNGTWTSGTRFNYQGGYFEQVQGDNWVENQDSGDTYNFVRIQPGQVVKHSISSDHLVVLYDKSRDIYVRLTDTQAFFNFGFGGNPNADYWEPIGENPTGTWTSNTRFTDQTGYFEPAQGNNWVEVQNSGDTHNFVRVN